MPRFLHALFLHSLLFSTFAFSQSAAAVMQSSTSGPVTTTLQTGITLVPVDVVVTDPSGHAVPGLKPSDFQITENNAPQSTRTFEVVAATAASASPQLPPLPPGVFTDYAPAGAAGPLNILLVDVLNTPLNAQIYLKEQLRAYVRQSPPHSRTAIFGLNAGLTMLQGFAADPVVLREAIDHKFTPGRSEILNDSTGNRDGSANDSTGLGPDSQLAQQSRQVADAAALVGQFEAQQQARQTQTRILDTINAFTVLGHYLASFPGRKNLVWFSGSFPINVLGDPSIQSPFQVTENNATAFHAMVDALLQAQVAVYPVDARALETSPTFDAAHPGSGYVGITGGRLSQDLATFQASRADEHATMEALAHDSGGKAFFNTNALAEAVAAAVSSGADYYTLAYTPTDTRRDGGFRAIHVELVGEAATHGYVLSYRRGYYAQSTGRGGIASKLAESRPEPGKKEGAEAGSVPFEATAMGHGAPAPSELLFKVRLMPASAEPQANVAPGNHVNTARAKGPFRTYSVDFAALTRQLQLTLSPDGRRTGHVEFVVYVFDPEGNLLVTAGQPLDLNLSAEEYKSLAQQGLKLHMNVSAPARGESSFRLALHDLDSRKMGVVEVPSTSVSRLLPSQGAAASGAAQR